MTQLRHDYINNMVSQLARSLARQETSVNKQERDSAKADALESIVSISAGTLIDINRCADALERIADVQEARLKIETAKAQLMTKAMTPPPPLATRVIINPGELGG